MWFIFWKKFKQYFPLFRILKPVIDDSFIPQNCTNILGSMSTFMLVVKFMLTAKNIYRTLFWERLKDFVCTSFMLITFFESIIARFSPFMEQFFVIARGVSVANIKVAKKIFSAPSNINNNSKIFEHTDSFLDFLIQ